ncbi:MAG: tRNA (adenosine(37)-N6)-dimethylallyltransferase MiaA [Oscillospiraceae bacterium]
MAGTVYVVTGPTATGKTELGVRLAGKISGEVVSADSMQLYKLMDIGTAKPTREEMGGIPHHMIDVFSPFEDCSAAMYVDMAAKCCDDIISRGKTPVIVGGTGLYIESLISGRSFAHRDADEAVREKYSAMYDELGGTALLRLLGEQDPERAEKLHPNDKKRIVRALEVLEAGDSITEHDRKTQELPPRYDAKYIVLNFEDRQELYSRIDRRVDVMMERGLAAEVKKLMELGLGEKNTAMQAIGYKEICAALSGKCSMDEAVETVKRESRRYAKRQISWCRRYQEALRINWKKTPDFDEALRLSTAF